MTGQHELTAGEADATAVQDAILGPRRGVHDGRRLLIPNGPGFACALLVVPSQRGAEVVRRVGARIGGRVIVVVEEVGDGGGGAGLGPVGVRHPGADARRHQPFL